MATGKVLLFPGFKELLLPYLEFAPLMPPKRLQYSKLLGRPCMADMELEGNDEYITPIFADEAMYLACALECTWISTLGAPMTGNLPSTALRDPHDPVLLHRAGPARDLIWTAIVVDDGDKDFNAAWIAKYSYPWPFVGEGTAHPALSNLLLEYDDFYLQWQTHSERLDDEFQIEPRGDREDETVEYRSDPVLGLVEAPL